MAVAILIVMGGALYATLLSRPFGREESRLLMLAFGAHVIGSVLQYVIQEFYYGISDAHAYLEYGSFMARAAELDFTRFAPEILKVILHLDNIFPADSGGGEGSSTSTMAGLAAVICFLFDDSLLGACLVTTVLTWTGQLFMYRAAREHVQPDDRRALLYATMLMPSVLFWSAGFNKEAFALTGLGMFALGLERSLAARRLWYAPLAVAGAVLVGVTKPYILFPFVLAVGAWLYVARVPNGGSRRFRPAYLVAAAIVAVGGVTLIGQIFPNFAPDKVAETTAMQQSLWTQTEGGSTVMLGSGEAKTPLEQLPFVPLAFANSLFRPLLIEARNPPMLGAAIETTWLAVVLVNLLRRFRTRRVREAIFASPPLAFSVVFVVTFAVAVGLATRNLGSLSRYRMPMIPMYAGLLLVLRSQLRRETALATDHEPRVGATRVAIAKVAARGD